MPGKTKYRFYHRLKYEGLAKGNETISRGTHGLQALDGAWITANQIEAARKVISKYIKKTGKMVINVRPSLPKSKKALGVRMGGGKSSIDCWVAVVKKNLVMFEIKDLADDVAVKALSGAAHKLPIRCKVIKQYNNEENKQ